MENWLYFWQEVANTYRLLKEFNPQVYYVISIYIILDGLSWIFGGLTLKTYAVANSPDTKNTTDFNPNKKTIDTNNVFYVALYQCHFTVICGIAWVILGISFHL